MITARTFTIMCLIYTATMLMCFALGLGSPAMIIGVAVVWASWGRAYGLEFRGFDQPEPEPTEIAVWGRAGAEK